MNPDPRADYVALLVRAETHRQQAKTLRAEAAMLEHRAQALEEEAGEIDRPCPQCGVVTINDYTSCFGVCNTCFAIVDADDRP